MSFKVIGHIIKAHGLKGEIQVHLDVPECDFFCSLKNVFIGSGTVPDEVYELDFAAVQNGKLIAALKNVGNRSESEKLKGFKLFIPEDKWNDLQEQIADLPNFAGWQIIDTESEKKIAEASQLIDDPRYATPLLEIERDGRYSLIPWNDEFIIRTDESRRQIWVKLQEGLLNED
jgi:16S rRNA processing protein RimM